MTKLQFYGERAELAQFLEGLGLVGAWEDKGKSFQFRARSGEIVNFYSNGTVNAQGANQAELKSRLSDFCGAPRLKTDRPAPVSEVAHQTKIFIVHGHDEAARNELELVLHRLNLKPYILQNSSGGSRTIVEALEDEIIKDSAFGIVLITPDDMGFSCAAGGAAAKPRARQNVILELGMVMAALTRRRMVIIKKRGEMELPSDTDGILRLEYDTKVQEQVAGLVQSLKNAGIDVDPALIAAAAR